MTIPDAAKLARYDDLASTVEELHDENMLLRQAIKQTLEENGHLTDSENCTLILLKRALQKVCGHDWQDDGDNLQIVCRKCGERHDVDLSWRPGEVEELINSAFPESELHNAGDHAPRSGRVD